MTCMGYSGTILFLGHHTGNRNISIISNYILPVLQLGGWAWGLTTPHSKKTACYGMLHSEGLLWRRQWTFGFHKRRTSWVTISFSRRTQLHGVRFSSLFHTHLILLDLIIRMLGGEYKLWSSDTVLFILLLYFVSVRLKHSFQHPVLNTSHPPFETETKFHTQRVKL
jgi:hypothetical protein